MTTYTCVSCGGMVLYHEETRTFAKSCAHETCGVAAHLTATVVGVSSLGQSTDAD